MFFCSFVIMIKKQGTILIVDDNRNILTTVRMLLDPIFHNIITIANPNSIPAKLREEHPDVVLLDMNFSSGINSGNEGLYWLREIKSLSPKTEVVLFTAYADIQLAVTGIKEGAADFIVKPFDNEKMISTLTEARDKNKTADKAMGKHSGKAAQSVMYWGDSEAMTNLRHVVEKVAAQWKSTGDVFLFHSILYLCIMNMLEQLARLVLPKEILDYFDIVKIETDESDIDSMSMTIHLDERMNAYLQKSEDYESKGFMDAVRITDFPIRDHKVILVLRRRRWKNKETGETFVDRISVSESGTRYSKEFAAFLKETYGHIPDDLPYA